MKKIVMIIVLLAWIIKILAQNNADTVHQRPKNNFNIGILADASLISINYERIFLLHKRYFISAKLGFGNNGKTADCNSQTCTTQEENYLTFPHHLTINFGKKKHFFELGINGTIITGDTNKYVMSAIVGYRIQPFKVKKINFRIFYNVPFDKDDTFYVFPNFTGISCGYCF